MEAKRYPRFFNDPDGRKRFDQLSQQEQNDIWDDEHRMMIAELVNPELYKEGEIAPGLVSKYIAPGIHACVLKDPRSLKW